MRLHVGLSTGLVIIGRYRLVTNVRMAPGIGLDVGLQRGLSTGPEMGLVMGLGKGSGWG